MTLRSYQHKRDFSKTSEPAGRVVATKRRRMSVNKELRYVIQKHAATRLHYDFRLELDGVLKSWAAPKGPSFDPAEKRLAVQVEDHPLEYATFEGTIPAGEYGGGEVIVWDRGTWTPDGDPSEGLAAGKLNFSLEGKKLRGGWSLVRMDGRERGKTNWLLMKRRDEFADANYDVVSERPESVKSKRRIEELKKSSPARPRNAFPKSIEPQLATLVASPPEGENWCHEIKFDGYRMLVYLTDGKVRLMTRNHKDWTHRYHEICDTLRQLPVHNAILDGEIVALLPNGLSSFQALQNASKGRGDDARAAPLAYFAFDLLYVDGEDLRKKPLAERKRRLAAIVPGDDRIVRYSEHMEAAGCKYLEEACRLGLEGIISKRLDRPYVSGRSGDWVKSKCLGQEELVIGGFTLSAKMPKGFGALLVGYYSDGQLHYAGRVGTGFTATAMRKLRSRLDALRRKDSPFGQIPKKAINRTVRWVEPELVAQVRFSEWTDEGVMRHPAFLGLREDKRACEVRRPASFIRKAVEKPKTLDIRLTHPERVLFPKANITKLDLANYYAQIAPVMLPHVVDRPLSIVRCPDGQEGDCFFQKHAGPSMPAGLGRVTVQEKKGASEYVFIRHAEQLASLAQVSALEIHLWGALRDKLDRPDRLIFDLDPDVALPWKRVVEAALRVREALLELGLRSFVKTTGGKGLHVVAPLSPRRRDWNEVKSFAKSVAEELARAEPRKYTASMSKAKRHEKVFIDYLRNDFGSTAVAPYSTRRHPFATVAMPLEWEALAETRPDRFTAENAVALVHDRRRDPWEEMFAWRQTI